MSSYRTGRAVLDVMLEREQQTKKHGVQTHLPDGTGPDGHVLEELGGLSAINFEGASNSLLADLAKRRCKAASQNEGGDGSITFEHILTEEWAEVLAEEDQDALRTELVQLAAVAVQWIEKLDEEADR